jgi:hypothetical protein
MKYRKLRIAWSVAWGVVAVLLCVLWVRSYWRYDLIEGMSFTGSAITKYFRCASARGQITILAVPTYRSAITAAKWRHKSGKPGKGNALGVLGFHYDELRLGLPHWLFSIAVAVVAALPWFRFRFSLRTLFIVTTLVAVALGLIVWASR